MKTTLLLSLVTCGFLLGCHTEKKADDPPSFNVAGDKISMAADSPQIASLTVDPVESRDGSIVHLTGKLIWDDNVTVRIFTPFAGRVRRILVEVGQHVKRGTPLAEIEAPDFGQAQSDAYRAESEYRLAERNFNRIRDLFEHGAAAKKDVESAQADYDRTLSEKKRTAARLATYGADGDVVDQQFMLKSPLDGVVVEKNLTPGQEVRPDQMLANAPQFFAPLFVVTDPRRLWLLLDASEHDLSELRPGEALLIHSQAYPDRTFRGMLDVVTDALDPNTRTVKVRGSIDNHERLLKAEMYVSVDLREATGIQIDIPKGAVLLKNEKYYVFVEEALGQYARREIRIGPEHDGKITVVNGLDQGKRVVTDGNLLLQQLLDSAKGS